MLSTIIHYYPSLSFYIISLYYPSLSTILEKYAIWNYVVFLVCVCCMVLDNVDNGIIKRWKSLSNMDNWGG